MSTPAESVSAALASAGTPVSASIAESIAERIGATKLRDAEVAGLVGQFAREELAKLNAEPVPLSRDERARQWLEAKGFNLSTILGEKKATLWDHALRAIDAADAAPVTAEARALERWRSKTYPDVVDVLNVANARIQDATGNKPVVGIPPVPSLPITNPAAPLNPMQKLAYANRLSGVALSTYREWAAVNALAVTMPAGVEKLKTQAYASNLARALQTHGVVVPT